MSFVAGYRVLSGYLKVVHLPMPYNGFETQARMIFMPQLPRVPPAQRPSGVRSHSRTLSVILPWYTVLLESLFDPPKPSPTGMCIYTLQITGWAKHDTPLHVQNSPLCPISSAATTT